MRIFVAFILLAFGCQQTTVNGQQTSFFMSTVNRQQTTDSVHIITTKSCTSDVYPRTVDGCPLSVDHPEDYHYLIVTPNNSGIAQWADTLARFRNEQGIYTKVVNIDDICDNKPIPLRDYFKYIYENWNTAPDAILLFGDYSTDATQGIASFYQINYHENNIKYLADNKLVDFDNDNLPELVIARMPAANAQQAELMVKKTIRYETYPSTTRHSVFSYRSSLLTVSF